MCWQQIAAFTPKGAGKPGATAHAASELDMNDVAKHIKRVVVLIFENGAFDHLFGAFPGEGPTGNVGESGLGLSRQGCSCVFLAPSQTCGTISPSFRDTT
jgi:phospholipase C